MFEHLPKLNIFQKIDYISIYADVAKYFYRLGDF